MSEILDNMDEKQKIIMQMSFYVGLIFATVFLFFYSLINALVFRGLWHIFILFLSMLLIFLFFKTFSLCSQRLKEVLDDDKSDV